MKNLNVLVYMPGYGGSFIKFLLSLDPSTYPHVPRNQNLTNNSQRKEFYSFRDLRKNFGWWVKFHQNFYDELDTINSFVDSEYQTCTIDSHPYEYYRLVRHRISQVNVDPVYLQVKISERFAPVIDHFNMLNGGFPGFRTGEERKDMQFLLEHDPYTICLDNFFKDTDHFVDEYERLNKFLQLPLYVDDALELYADWRRVRQLDQSLEWCAEKQSKLKQTLERYQLL